MNKICNDRGFPKKVTDRKIIKLTELLTKYNCNSKAYSHYSYITQY